MLTFIQYLIYVFALSIALSNSLNASEKKYDSVYVDEVTSIYDGDTFGVNINKWPPIIGQRIPIRIRKVDTPELRGKCQEEKELARKAKQHTVQMLRNAKRIELQNIYRGKYFRILADVSVDGKDLGESLIFNGFALPFDQRLMVSLHQRPLLILLRKSATNFWS